MQLSIHYYVLSLSKNMSRLYEGFRDKLIYIQNTNFPVECAMNATDSVKSVSKETQLKDFFRRTDQRFARYYEQDPLRLVIVGDKNSLTVFEVLTTHRDIVIGTVGGDYTATSPHDLGKIVWPVVKEAIAGANKNAMHNLAIAARAKKVVSGIEAVGQSAETETGSTLYVEDDYHVKGSIFKTDHSLVFSKHVNICEVLDDVVDVIIEKVLKMGGNVIFLNSGSLKELDRIALIWRD
jgi:hypothetical protein